ncbi:unnamed protein product [Diamesa hyperborea]
MKGARIQAQFIKRRDSEQKQFERTNEQRNYYDKWGRITSRHEHWTTPEYYKEADEKLQKIKLAEEKQKELEERKEKLRTLLAEEKQRLDREVSAKTRPKSRQVNNNVLENIRSTLYSADESKKRADLEGKLYSRWRYGMDQEKIIMDSKTDSHAMAKLSWLDRQVEKQIQNEKHKTENNELELKLQQEKSKHESYMQNCHKMRDSELNQLKTLQENHIQELKLRDRETHDLKLLESTLRKKLCEIQKEIEAVTTNNHKRRDRVTALHNYRRVKMILKDRSEAIRRDLKQDLSILDRISFDKDFDNNDEINYLREKFQSQFEIEAQYVQNIECMYESEAKDALLKQEEKWNDESMVREQQMKVLMEDRIQTLNDRINDSMRKQQNLIGIRETHLKSVEDCNERLKQIMVSSLGSGLNIIQPTLTDRTSRHHEQITNIAKKTDNLMITSNSELTIPKFGRKKIAWN